MKSLYMKSATFFIIFLALTMRIVQAQAVPTMHFACGIRCYIAWHPERDLLLIHKGFGAIRIWDVDGSTELVNFMLEGGRPVIWTPDGTAFTTLEVHSTFLRDAMDGHIIQQGDYIEWFDELDEQGLLPSGYTDFIETMAWNPDGTRLLFISGDFVAIWNIDTNTFEMVNTPEDRYWEDDKPFAIDWSPDGNTIALSTISQFALIDASTYEVQLQINYPPNLFSSEYVGYERLKWSPDGSWIAVAVHFGRYAEPARVLLFNPDSGAFERTYETEARFVRALEWSPDGRWLAAANGYEQVYDYEENVYDDNSVRIWDVEDNELAQLITFDSPVYMVDWSADSNYLATSTFSGDIDIWAINLD